MKAAVMHEVNQPLQMEEVDIDLPGPREVLVRTRASGVCHSDLHFIEGLYPTPTPAVLGHEASGTVEAVGSLVDYVSPGDRVICCLSVFCGPLDRFTPGRPVLCSPPGLVRALHVARRLSPAWARPSYSPARNLAKRPGSRLAAESVAGKSNCNFTIRLTASQAFSL